MSHPNGSGLSYNSIVQHRGRRHSDYRPSILPDTRSGAVVLALLILGIALSVAFQLHNGIGGALGTVLGILFIMLGAALGITISVRAYRISGELKHPPGHCQSCGYDLTGNV